ncbi:MAG: methylthioribulose 1-phosphate dehydratase, partial [Pontibacterium sp.]
SRHWCPATGGNFSVRLSNGNALITGSGCHKGMLTPANLLEVDLKGQPVNAAQKPSAETLLHTKVYELDAQAGAVLHTHSVASTVLSRLCEKDYLSLSGYEMQKSLSGNMTHDEEIRIAILENDQDMQHLAQCLTERWQQSPLAWGFLVRGHGLYSWGRDMAEARRHLEGMEFLFDCELEMKRLQR